ncbi:nucleoside hydrolase [Arenimonas caeni]|jgi:purine nucleosidase|uniref:nucleoside hydrolase n=1 Tax=Arenimonas caeni TaxID=2058085 RepID=UPI002A36E779|nr:nucleoside hydrolase [Arenimonas caeni]MDY0023117.1 nucleoside hydrolase [Arenimonas caeni]
MNERIPLLIDTDPGVDDALALLMAFADPRHELKALTIAAGNVGLGHTVANALKLCEIAGVDVPVHPGCPVPLLHAAADAAYVHGQDGFGDTGYAPAARRPQDEHAALAILRIAREHAGRLLLVTLGPLTNLALALRLDPTLPSRVGRLVVMGGAVTGQGNTSVPAEFNIAFDPEAADIVFRSFPKAEVVDWEAVLRHGFLHTDVDAWLAAGDARARFYDAISLNTRRWSAERRGERWHSADALAMAVALAPGGVRRAEDRPLAVELEGRLSRGATVVDWQRRSGQPDNARIVLDYDQAAFEARVRGALGA